MAVLIGHTLPLSYMGNVICRTTEGNFNWQQQHEVLTLCWWATRVTHLK